MNVDRYGDMSGTVAEFDFLEDLGNALDQACADGMSGFEGLGVLRSFDEAGVLSANVGMVVRFSDGREFQVTVVQSGGKREYVDDDDEEA